MNSHWYFLKASRLIEFSQNNRSKEGLIDSARLATLGICCRFVARIVSRRLLLVAEKLFACGDMIYAGEYAGSDGL